MASILHSEFCGTKNKDLEIEPEEIPQGDCFDFMLGPAPQAQAGAGAKVATEQGAKDVKKKVTPGVIIYCIDISGSMGGTCNVPEFQAAWRAERTQGQSSLEIRSRLDCIKEAVKRQIEQLNIDQPEKPVMVVTFEGNRLDVRGGGSWVQQLGGQPAFSDLSMRSFEALTTKGKELAETYRLNPLTDSYSALNHAVSALHPGGGTPLGPALSICAGYISNFPSSEIVLCTDGMPNVGIGSLESGRQKPEFYRKVGEYAKNNKTVINILAVEGEPVGLPQVKVAAEVSGGTVNVLNPLEIVRQLRQIMQNAMVATGVTVTIFLHPGFVFDEPGYLDNTSRLSKELGNVLKEDSLTFRFKLKNTSKPPSVDEVPFQIQIQYTRRDGMRCLRILSKSNKATSSREEMEEAINVAVVGAAAVRKTAALAEEGKVKEANVHLKAVKRLAKRGAKTVEQREELFAFKANSQDLDDEITENIALWDLAPVERRERRAEMLFAKMNEDFSPYICNVHTRFEEVSRRRASERARDLYYGYQF